MNRMENGEVACDQVLNPFDETHSTYYLCMHLAVAIKIHTLNNYSCLNYPSSSNTLYCEVQAVPPHAHLPEDKFLLRLVVHSYPSVFCSASDSSRPSSTIFAGTCFHLHTIRPDNHLTLCWAGRTEQWDQPLRTACKGQQYPSASIETPLFPLNLFLPHRLTTQSVTFARGRPLM